MRPADSCKQIYDANLTGKSKSSAVNGFYWIKTARAGTKSVAQRIAVTLSIPARGKKIFQVDQSITSSEVLFHIHLIFRAISSNLMMSNRAQCQTMWYRHVLRHG